MPQSRRTFLKATAAGIGFWTAPQGAPAADNSPAEKLNLAFVGVANRARGNIEGCAGQNVVALCDVDERYLARAATEFPRARAYNDWRKLLEQKDIDAVVISTADHTHAGPTLAAMQLGKHVYCEKPLTHNVREARLVSQMAGCMKVATQMGTQIHATENYRRVVELLRSGVIGSVQRIHVWVPTVWSGGGERPAATQPAPPEHLHWDLWLGPAPHRPYHPAYHPFGWRGWWDFGGGALADMACHHMDLSHWAFDLRHPLSVEAEGPQVHPDSCPRWLIVHYRYPGTKSHPPIHLTWYSGDKRPAELADLGKHKFGAGSLFIGDKGMLLADYDRRVLLPEEQFKDFKAPEPTIPNSIGHHQEWIKACKEGGPTTCNFDYAGALTETVLLGNVAYRSGRKLQWDAGKMTIPNAPQAERYLTREYRKGWEL